MKSIKWAALALYVCVFGSSLALVPDAAAENFDGTWKGSIANWQVSLDVRGTKGDLTLVSCNGGTTRFPIDITPDGRIDAWVKVQGLARRHFETQLPNFAIPPGGNCPSGNGVLSRQ